MPQRVNRAGVRAKLAAVVPSSPGPDDLDSLSDNYLSLSEEVNGTPPLIRAGDAQYDSLVQLRQTDHRQ